MKGSCKPKLRFPEFSGNWIPTTIGDISANVGYGLNTSASSFDGVNGYIRITDIDGDHRFCSAQKTSPSGDLDDNYLLEDGDIVFVRTGATTGKTYKYEKGDGKLYFAGFLIRFSIKMANPDFVFQQTLTEKYRKWVSVMSMRSGQPGINAQEVKSYSFMLPNRDEQQKIADFLSAVDEKIRRLKEKHTLLQQYKKGVMQKLFSQEIRFKDDNGQAFPDWEQRQLSDVLTLASNTCVMDDDSQYTLVTVRRRYGGVDLRGVFRGKEILVKSQFTLKANQFLISKRQIVHGACGVVPKALAGAIVSNEYNVFDPEPNLLDIHYFFLFSQTSEMKRAYFINSDGVHIEKLLFKTNQWLKTKAAFPCLAEQTKITSFHDALDKKLDAVQQQIELTQTFKKGLLQQMFV